MHPTQIRCTITVEAQKQDGGCFTPTYFALGGFRRTAADRYFFVARKVARAQASDFACLRLVKHQLGYASDWL